MQTNLGPQIVPVTQTTGLIGFFDLYDFITSSNVNYHALEEKNVTRFNKGTMTSDFSHIYAIADNEYYTPKYDGGMVIGYYTNHTSRIYHVVTSGTHLISSNMFETVGVDLSDLSITANNVVAVGNFFDDIGSGLALVRFNNMTPTIGDTYYYYLQYEPITDYHSIGINNEQIAVASLWDSSSIYRTSIHFVDISTMDMVGTQMIPLFSKAETTEMAYIDADKSVVLQIPAPLSSNSSITESLHYRIDPSQTIPYPTYAFYFAGRGHYTLGCLAGLSAVGFNGSHWFIKDMLISPKNDCYDYFWVDIEQHSIVPKNLVDCLVVINRDPQSLSDIKPVNGITATNDCISISNTWYGK